MIGLENRRGEKNSKFGLGKRDKVIKFNSSWKKEE